MKVFKLMIADLYSVMNKFEYFWSALLMASLLLGLVTLNLSAILFNAACLLWFISDLFKRIKIRDQSMAIDRLVLATQDLAEALGKISGFKVAQEILEKNNIWSSFVQRSMSADLKPAQTKE